MKYYIFFFHSTKETKRGVEFRHLTRNTRNPEFGGCSKVGNGSVYMEMECPNTRFPSSLCLPSYVWDTRVKLKTYVTNYHYGNNKIEQKSNLLYKKSKISTSKLVHGLHTTLSSNISITY